MRPLTVGRMTVLASIAALLAVLGGCSADPFTPQAVDVDCQQTVGGPVTVAIGARANSPAPALPRQVLDLVREASKRNQRVRIIRVDGAPAEAFSGVFRSTAENNVARKSELDNYMARISDEVAQLQPKVAEADVLLALNEAARLTDKGGNVILLDSGVQTTGQIRLQDPGTFDAEPSELATYLKKNSQLPDLTGRSVMLIGLGNTANPQPPITDPSLRAKILTLWQTVAREAGASCIQVLETSGTRDSIETDIPVAVVAYPQPPKFVACGSTVLRDGDTVGFVPDQAVFRNPDAARQTLQMLADTVRNGGQSIKLIGTTATAGQSEAGRVALSLQRAQAVKAVLVQLGIAADRITTVGAGSRGPNHVNDLTPDGTLIPALAAQNRSVVVQLTCATP